MYDYDVKVEEWEEPGWTIAEHTTSPPLDWSIITGVTLHYPADPHIRAEPTRPNLISHLQNAQRSYVSRPPPRNYSYGYNAVVWGGLSGEVRGDNFRCAANGNTTLNEDKFAIQIRVEGQTTASEDTSTPATPADIEEVNRLITWCEQQAGRPLEIGGHRELKPTGCPGDAIFAQITAGVFHSNPPEVSTMQMFRFTELDTGPAPLFATVDGLHCSWLSGPQFAALGGTSGNVIDVLDRAEAIRFTMVGPIPPDHYGIWGSDAH
jgi:hypothetical protein